MIAHCVFSALLWCLFIVLAVEHGNRRAAEARAKLLEEQIIYESDRHQVEVGHYQKAIEDQQKIVNDLTLKLAARTYEERRGLEPQGVEFIMPMDDEELAALEERERQERALMGAQEEGEDG